MFCFVFVFPPQKFTSVITRGSNNKRQGDLSGIFAGSSGQGEVSLALSQLSSSDNGRREVCEARNKFIDHNNTLGKLSLTSTLIVDCHCRGCTIMILMMIMMAMVLFLLSIIYSKRKQ